MNCNDEPSRALPVEVGAQPLAALIARVEAATGPDRELDELLSAYAVGAIPERQSSGRLAFHRDGSWVSIGPVEPLTASLDAALSLVERVLPGWGYDVTYRAAWGNHTACVIANDRHAPPYTAAGSSAALALILALLRALQAQSIRHNARDGATPQSNEPSTRLGSSTTPSPSSSSPPAFGRSSTGWLKRRTN